MMSPKTLVPSKIGRHLTAYLIALLDGFEHDELTSSDPDGLAEFRGHWCDVDVAEFVLDLQKMKNYNTFQPKKELL